MAMQIELNGVMTTVTKEQILALAANGTIHPETIIIVDGTKQYKAAQIKGIAFANGSAEPYAIAGQNPYATPNTSSPQPMQTPSEKQWYYSQNNVQQGPVPERVVIQYIKSLTINANTLVWREGMSNWARLADTELSFHLAPNTPPQMPPMPSPQMPPAYQQSPNVPTHQPMIYCSACGNQVLASAFVCPKCGTKIAKPGGGGGEGGIHNAINDTFGLKENSPQKSRTIYVLFAIFLFGGIGLHNFYAGRTKQAIMQLVIGLIGLILIIPLIVTCVWAIYDAITVKEDGLGRPFI